MLPVVQKAPQNLQCQLLMLQLACATEETEMDVIMLLLSCSPSLPICFEWLQHTCTSANYES